MSDDEDDFEPDPEIQLSIFNGLAYEIATKHAAIFDAVTGVEYDQTTRRKRKKGELCLRCNTVPSKNYDPEKRWNNQGFCDSCEVALKEAGELCLTCNYAFDKERYMHNDILCTLCHNHPDAPVFDFRL